MTDTTALGVIPLYIHRPHPFANPVVDSIRAVCVVAAVVLAMWMFRVVREQSRREGGLQRGQVARFVGLGFLAVSVAYTEIVVQGTEMTWRLPINLLGVGFSAYGIWAMRRGQKRR